MNITVVTTFPNFAWELYAKKMLQTFVQYWPTEVPIMVQLDDNKLSGEVDKILRPQDGLACGWSTEHKSFAKRHKDDPANYRKQPVRFCHKIFALKDVYEANNKSKEAGGEHDDIIIWLDADVHTLRPVSIEEIKQCLPKDSAAVSYLGRKDWPHSECGWLAFDLNSGGGDFIETLVAQYTSDNVLKMEEWHDSWVFDVVRKSKGAPKATNLTEDKPGMDIWPHSPMAKWSVHYKGPVAKQGLTTQKMPKNANTNIIIQTQNAIPNEQIHKHIEENQKLIKDWIVECETNEEEIVVVSAGPLFVAEDLIGETRKIVAVKHAMKPLKAAGIKPWACILLDPRPHVIDFVDEPDTDVIWFVASQVNPDVTRNLVCAGCKIMGYHASVGAEEGFLTNKQANAIVHGGSATATRGLFVLNHLGFRKFRLYGYDLCYPDKPDFSAIDDRNQPRYLEMSIGNTNPLYAVKRCFWTEPQFVAQLEEMNDILKTEKFDIEAFGEGIVPFVVKSKKVTELRQGHLHSKMPKLSSYRKLIRWKTSNKKTNFLTKLLKR